MDNISPMYIALAALAGALGMAFMERLTDTPRHQQPLPPTMEACLKRGDKLVLDFKGGSWACERP